MKFIFLGGLYPSSQRDEIIKNSKRGVQFAADIFQKSIIQGLIDNGMSVSIVSSPFISSFPFGYKKLFIKGGNFEFNQQMIGKMTSFINFPFFRFRFNNLQHLLHSSINKSDACCIVVYSLQHHLIKAALKAKKKFPKVKICFIIPDLPEYMSFNRIYTSLGLKKKDIRYIYNHLGEADYYVLLTEQMADRLNIKDKKWVCVEGIFNDNLKMSQNKAGLQKVLFYSGAIHKRYGLPMLLDAFDLIKEEDYQLWICGDGDYKQEILSRAERDSRIKYLGILPSEKVLELQKKASLLINPRSADGEYTKYSFPSKTMEYLASGTPALMYILPGIPAEYHRFFYKIPNNATPVEMAEKIVEICKQSPEKLSEFGKKASEFIRNNKNPKMQVEKILDMFNQL